VSGKGIARVPTEVTVGIDIGTTSVKAVAADAEGK
jgi:sugar (pentulose or hexulose) kinase